MPNAALRPSLASDAGFLYEAVDGHFRPLVEALGRTWSVARNQEKCRHDAASGDTRIIEVDGYRAGFLTVQRRADGLWVESLVLLPVFRRQGVGGHVVAALTHEADEQRTPMRLGVLKNNPVQPFWARHGFRTVGEIDPMHVLMERDVPPTPPGPAAG